MLAITGIGKIPFFMFFLIVFFLFVVVFAMPFIDFFGIVFVFLFSSFVFTNLAINSQTVFSRIFFMKIRKRLFLIAFATYFYALLGKIYFLFINISSSAIKTVTSFFFNIRPVKFFMGKNTVTLWAIFKAKFFCIKSFFIRASATFANWRNAIMSGFVFIESCFNWFFLLAFGAIFEDTIHCQISLLDLAVSRLFAATRDFSCQLPLNYNIK